MIELLQSYNLVEVLIVLIMVALAIKGAVDLWEWQAKHFWHTVDNLKHKEKTEKQITGNSDDIADIRAELKEINNKVSELIASDKDDIKAYITEKHRQYCYDKGSIDDYTLECIERRYQHYKIEGGNSFIDGFMEEIRSLPRKA